MDMISEMFLTAILWWRVICRKINILAGREGLVPSSSKTFKMSQGFSWLAELYTLLATPCSCSSLVMIRPAPSQLGGGWTKKRENIFFCSLSYCPWICDEMLVDVNFASLVGGGGGYYWDAVHGIVCAHARHSSHQTTHIFIATFLETQTVSTVSRANKASPLSVCFVTPTHLHVTITDMVVNTNTISPIRSC